MTVTVYVVVILIFVAMLAVVGRGLAIVAKQRDELLARAAVDRGVLTRVADALAADDEAVIKVAAAQYIIRDYDLDQVGP